ncbi:MAG: hypothetical protein ACP5PO_06230 [Desulfurella sp.]|uniref:hypothetical protein n=1 Tax=Desulfurella sp. TaxID=1962857 RepID=UPI003D0DAC79
MRSLFSSSCEAFSINSLKNATNMDRKNAAKVDTITINALFGLILIYGGVALSMT